MAEHDFELESEREPAQTVPLYALLSKLSLTTTANPTPALNRAQIRNPTSSLKTNFNLSLIDPEDTDTTIAPPDIDTDMILALDRLHNITPPPMPSPPPTLAPSSSSLSTLSDSLRYPDTLGSLITILPCAEAGKGLGIFALVDLEPGTIVLSEYPLFVLIDTGTRADPMDQLVSALTPERRAAFLSLMWYKSSLHESEARARVYSNGYSVMDDKGTGVFETASRINHSCVPNCSYNWHEDDTDTETQTEVSLGSEIGTKSTSEANSEVNGKVERARGLGGDLKEERRGRMVFWNRFKILKGEEITVDYGHRRGWLKRIYGFDCQCGGCTEMGTVSSIDLEAQTEHASAGVDVSEGANGVDGGFDEYGGCVKG